MAPFSISFGAELELIFVFHESAILPHISRLYPGASLHKSIPSADEPKLRQKHYHDSPYRSWAIKSGGNNPQTAEASVLDPSDGNHFRAYKDEPLHLARSILAELPGRSGTQVYWAGDHSKQQEYGEWTITSDHSVGGISKEEILTALPGRVNESNVEEWDSFGIEIISPPSISPDEAAADWAAIIAALQGSDSSPFGLVLSRQCGLHVHVGKPDGTLLPENTLQHLAYLLVVHEEEIDKLHAPWRKNREDEVGSNLQNFYADYGMGEKRVVRKEIAPGTFEEVTQMSSLKPLEEVRRNLFDDVVKTEGVVDRLKKLQLFIGFEKGYKVSFKNTTPPDGRAATVEFRQHDATLSSQDILWWTKFCIGMVRLAHQYAETGTSCTVQSWQDPHSVQDLFDAMHFPIEGRAFYTQKIMEYEGHAEAVEVPQLWEDYEEDDDEGWPEEGEGDEHYETA